MSRTHREGGLNKRDQTYKKVHASKRRVLEKKYYHNVQEDNEHYLNSSIDDGLTHVTGSHKGFFWWRLITKWLKTNVGRSWNDVHSELVKKLKEIESDNILINKCIDNAVDLYGKYKDYCIFKYNYYVDNNGLLQLRECDKKRLYPYYNWKTTKMTNWLNGRVVGKVGENLYWFTPVVKGKKHRGLCRTRYKCEYNRGYNYLYGSPHGLIFYSWGQKRVYNEDTKTFSFKDDWVETSCFFKQDKLLSEKDVLYWNSIPTQYQEEVLKFAPVNRN